VTAAAASGPAILVDARGHRCPVPSLRLRRALEACADDGEVELLTDDPLARIDVPHLVNSLRYLIVLSEVEGSLLRFKIRKTRATRQGAAASPG
jgi:tRNA 2-thiouridine synthesizing protein A